MLPSTTALLILTLLATIAACCCSAQGQVNFHGNTDRTAYLAAVCTSKYNKVGGRYGALSSMVIQAPGNDGGIMVVLSLSQCVCESHGCALASAMDLRRS